MTRIIPVSALALLTVCWFGSVGCSSSNDPSTGGTNTGSSGSGTGPIGPSGGTDSGGSTGTPSGGDNSVAGSTTIAGSGGSGTTAGGSTGSDMFTPLCATFTTTLDGAGPSPTKGGMCAATDPVLCYKTCGPKSTGFKSESCMGGAYVEQSGCSFPDTLDASCFKIPDALPAACPTDVTPQASQPCTVADCTLCYDANGQYYDSTMTLKTGYCVCAVGSSGTGKWSCASNTAWPCPNGMGCN